MPCRLCGSTELNTILVQQRIYEKCDICQSIQLHERFFITSEQEKTRYLTHNNDIYDIRYQRFIKPLVDEVLLYCSLHQKGLDFGAGTGPVASYLLKQHGFYLMLYDPFFHPVKNIFDQKFDFIIASEVIEHFHDPKLEFDRLYKMLNEGGILFLMTDLWNDTKDFKTWYYLNDSTHVFFYHQKTFKWIQQHYNIQSLEIKSRVIRLKK
jgi:SAM-dependent methyltransferase